MKSKRHVIFISVSAVALVFQALMLSRPIHAQGLTGSIKGTVSATAADTSARPSLIPAARLSLVNRDIQGAAVKIVTDEAGNFAFLDLPAANYTLTAEADGLPVVKQDIRLTTGAALVVEIVYCHGHRLVCAAEEGMLGTAEQQRLIRPRAEAYDLPLGGELRKALH